jgi:hypothetical protein
MKVKVHLLSQSQPATHEGVVNAYTKDGMFCILGEGEFPVVVKYPLCNIFRVTETYK